MEDKCVICRKQIREENEDTYHTLSGLLVCNDCTDIYETVYALINGTKTACYVKRKVN